MTVSQSGFVEKEEAERAVTLVSSLKEKEDITSGNRTDTGSNTKVSSKNSESDILHVGLMPFFFLDGFVSCSNPPVPVKIFGNAIIDQAKSWFGCFFVCFFYTRGKTREHK